MTLRSFLVLIFVLSAITTVNGAEIARESVDTVPDISAKSYLLIDYNSGNVLAEKNADQRFEPGDLTKMMTSYAVDLVLREGRVRRSDLAVISDAAFRTGGTRMFLKAGGQVAIEDLLKGMIIQSGNDAAVALAERISGNDTVFADLMNETAVRLGMGDTHFVNSTGIPASNHYTTARDLAQLARAMIHDFPETYSLYSIKEYTFNGVKQFNRNGLLWRDSAIDGIKAAQTSKSGFEIVASAQSGDMRLIAVVLGARDEKVRADETQRLLAYGFRAFETHLLYAAQAPLTEARLWRGEKNTVSLGLISDMYVTIPKGQYENLKARIDLVSRIFAPTMRGQALGTVTVSLGEDVFAEMELVSLESVEPGGFVNNLVDNVRMILER